MLGVESKYPKVASTRFPLQDNNDVMHKHDSTHIRTLQSNAEVSRGLDYAVAAPKYLYTVAVIYIHQPPGFIKLNRWLLFTNAINDLLIIMKPYACFIFLEINNQ